jgi:unsaturated chondroitin disaccharide hydrolase
LAWAVYGFGTVYAFTGDARFLNTAEACAAYYIENTPAHGVPPNDWMDPDPGPAYESSAAAITASGLFNLALLTTDPLRSRLFRDYALRIVDTLTGPEFLAIDTPGWEGILKHGTYHQKKGLGVDESVMWGEYFFLEAVSKAIKELDHD